MGQYLSGQEPKKLYNKPCEKHPMEVTEVFCRKCQLPFCSECIQESHKKHPWCTLSKLVQEKIIVTRDKCRDLDALVEHYLQDVSTAKKKIAQEKATTISRLEEQKNSICAVLETKTNKMIKSLGKCYRKNEKILDDIEKTFQEGIDKIAAFHDKDEDFGSSGTSAFEMWEFLKDFDLECTKPDIEKDMIRAQYTEGEINTKLLKNILGRIQYGGQKESEVHDSPVLLSILLLIIIIIETSILFYR